MLVVQQVVNGLLIGGVYALFATGLTLTMGVLRVLNMTHGVTLSICAIAGVEIADAWNMPFPLLVLSGGVVGAIVGAFVETVAFRPLRRSRRHDEHSREWSTLISSLALLTILQSLAQLYTFNFTDNQILRFPPDTFTSTLIEIGGIRIRSISIVMFVVACVLTLLTWWVIRFTRVGSAARAVAADPEAAEMLGVNVNRYALAIVGASGAMAGIAGILIGVAFNSVDFLTGEQYLLKGFAVIVLGGIGSITGSLIGGLILGIAEGLTVHFIGSSWIEAVAFGLLFLVLVVRPQGLLGQAEVDRA
ncbi:MAG: branched-chain amino acid ABC transporter permease [Acidimicrobiia bacterium]